MTDAGAPRRVRRVVVALEPGRPNAAALEEAARLAARLRAELVGIYVEDVDWRAAAALPVTRLIPRQGVGRVALDAASMGRMIEHAVAGARRALASAAERVHVTWSFEVTHATELQTLLTQGDPGDVLALGREWHTRLRASAVATARGGQQCCSLLLLQRTRTRPLSGVIAVYEGDAAALATAQEFAEAYRLPLSVLVVASSEDAARTQIAEIAAWLRANRLPERVEALVTDSVTTVGAFLQRARPGVVIADATRGVVATDPDALLDTVDCSVLLLR